MRSRSPSCHLRSWLVYFPRGCKQANYANESDASNFVNVKNHFGMAETSAATVKYTT